MGRIFPVIPPLNITVLLMREQGDRLTGVQGLDLWRHVNIVFTFGNTSRFFFWSASYSDVGDGRGIGFEEALLLIDIAGCGGA